MNENAQRELNNKARTDLTVLGVAVVLAFVVELFTGALNALISYFGDALSLTAGGFVVVPLVLAAGLAVFYYRQYHQLQNAVEAHGRAERRAEDARMESEEMQRLNQGLVEYGLEVLVKVDENGRIIQVNEDMERATGRNGRNLVGTEMFSHFDDPDAARKLFDDATSSGSTVQDRGMEIRHRDGSETPVSTTIVVQQNRDESVAGGILICRA